MLSPNGRVQTLGVSVPAASLPCLLQVRADGWAGLEGLTCGGCFWGWLLWGLHHGLSSSLFLPCSTWPAVV